jgi:hypothetical protein
VAGGPGPAAQAPPGLREAPHVSDYAARARLGKGDCLLWPNGYDESSYMTGAAVVVEAPGVPGVPPELSQLDHRACRGQHPGCDQRPGPILGISTAAARLEATAEPALFGKKAMSVTSGEYPSVCCR